MKERMRILILPVIFCVGLILFSVQLVLNPISVFADELASCTANCGGGVSVSCGGAWATTCTAIDGRGCTAGGGSKTDAKLCSDAKKPSDESEMEQEESGQVSE